MKSSFICLLSAFICLYSFAQAPDGFNYQGIARDNLGKELINKSISLRLSILKDSIKGTSVYTEAQAKTTNSFGLFTLKVGTGTAISGNFSQIDWSTGLYFLKVEMDANGGTNYTLMGTSQMLSVPYALYSKTSGSIGGHYIGELYGGGVIFYVDQTGKHGLICSMIDLSISQIWSNVSTTLIGNIAQSDWDGNTNTMSIIGQTGQINSAAKLCSDYTNINYGTGVFSDWYLPSRGEFNNLWNNIMVVQKALDTDGDPATTPILKAVYWSSSEYNDSRAYEFDLMQGYPCFTMKSFLWYVRAIRAF
jgi:hypothetical protein